MDSSRFSSLDNPKRQQQMTLFVKYSEYHYCEKRLLLDLIGTVF